jgi:hypothetical protein
LHRGGLVNSHDNKGVLAYSFGLLSQPTSGNVLAIALKDTGMFRGRRTLDIDGRNTMVLNVYVVLCSILQIQSYRMVFAPGASAHSMVALPYPGLTFFLTH